MKKYDIKNNEEYAIRSEDGPNFGNADLYLEFELKKGQTYALDNCNFLSDNNLESTGGKGESENFETQEFEVFRVIY